METVTQKTTDTMTVKEVEDIVGENEHIKCYKNYCKAHNKPYDPNFKYKDLSELFLRCIRDKAMADAWFFSLSTGAQLYAESIRCCDDDTSAQQS